MDQDIEKNWDAIAIGSGMGSLCFATLYSKLFKKRVLVLEQHSKVGGLNHIFKRPPGFVFDVGLHYVGDMEKGAPLRKLMDTLTGGEVEWQKMNDPFERMQFPKLTFDVFSNEERYMWDLIRKFPEERKAIERYFKVLKKTAKASGFRPFSENVFGFIFNIFGRLLFAKSFKNEDRTTKSVLDDYFKSPELKAVLAGIWGTYGLPPSKSAFGLHALIANHYLKGGWYPIGSSQRLGASIQKHLESMGSKVLVKEPVKEILMDLSGRACGVKTQTEKEFHAPLIVSGIGARRTFQYLLKEDKRCEEARNEMEEIHKNSEPFQVVVLYIGFKESPEKLLFRGENYWFFASTDHDELYAKRNELVNGVVSTYYMSFPSLKDPTAQFHTAQVIAPLDYKVFEKWKSEPVKNRSDDYKALKEKISQALLSKIEENHPGFKAIVDYHDLGTALTVEHYSKHISGGIYGVPGVPARYKAKYLKPKTPVPGLMLTGSDVGAHGIAGAMMGGVLTLGALNGANILKKIFRS